MKLQPMGDRILVKALESRDRTKGGIVLPDTAKERPQEGTVVAVGHGRFLEDGSLRPLEVKTGDTVLYGKYAGTEVKVEDKDYLILREEDVLAIVTSTPTAVGVHARR